MVIGKGIAYAVLLILIAGVTLGFISGVDKAFSRVPNYNVALSHFLIFMLMVIVLIFVLPKIKTGTEKAVERALFKNKYEYRDNLRNFSRRLTFIPSQDELLRQTVNNAATAFNVPRTLILLRDDISGEYITKAQVGLSDTKIKKSILSPESPIIDWLNKNKKTFVKDEAEKVLSGDEMQKINKDLENLGTTLCIPLLIENRLIGVLALSDRKTGEMFSHLDIGLLESLATQIALSISYKRLESQILRADKLTSLGTLAAGIAHEIRNPLSSIQTFAQLLPEKYNDKEFREEFGKIVANDTTRIAHLIDNILSLASPKPPVFSTYHIKDVIDETLSLIDTEIRKGGVKVIKNYSNELPRIKGDKEQLKQVFINIFLNAIKAMSGSKDAKLEISAMLKQARSLEKKKSIEDYVRIEIGDNGPGIEENLLDKLFEPFFTTRHEGTGLGLAITHKIIEEHKGRIEVDSTVGKGTTFWVNLPVEDKK